MQEGAVRIQIGLGIHGNYDSFRPEIAFTPEVIVSDKDGHTLYSAMRFAHHVLTFFELSLGARSRMRDVWIDEETWEMQLARAHRFASDNFQLRRNTANWLPSPEMARPWTVAFPVAKPQNRDQTAEALKRWIQRIPKWETTYALASFYMARRDVFDRDRLLRLCAWFESLPSIVRESDVTAAQLTKIVQQAQAGASTVERTDLSSRIQNSLSRLRETSLRQQFRQITRDLRARFGEHLIPQHLEANLFKAAELRGIAAHGGIAFDDDNSHTNITAIRALELVCFLATIADLVANDLPVDRIGNHPLVAYLRLQST